MFDENKVSDIYLLMQQINVKSYDKLFEPVYHSVNLCKQVACDIYDIFTTKIKIDLKKILNNIEIYVDEKELEQVKTDITDPDKYDEYYNDYIKTFNKVGSEFNQNFLNLVSKIKQNSSYLHENCRDDLVSGAFLYSSLQNIIKNEGDKVSEISNLIQTCYIEPMNELKAKIKEYDEKISQDIDPRNAFDNFIKALPSSEQFSSLAKFIEQTPDAQMEAMQAAYSSVVQAISYLASLTFTSMDMDIRNQIADKLDKLKNDYNLYNKQYKEIIDDYNNLKKLVTIINYLKFFETLPNEFLSAVDGIPEALDKSLQQKDVCEYHNQIKKLQNFIDNYY